MLSFKVVKENYGWAVRLGDGMSTPFWTRSGAVREAYRLCEGMRSHGVAAEVILDDESEAVEAPAPSRSFAPARLQMGPL